MGNVGMWRTEGSTQVKPAMAEKLKDPTLHTEVMLIKRELSIKVP